VNKAAAYNAGVVAAMVDAGLLKSADANALAEQLRQEPEREKRPLPPAQRASIPESEDDVSWGSKGSVMDSMLHNLGIDVRAPVDESYS
jgi:hypothetical protein